MEREGTLIVFFSSPLDYAPLQKMLAQHGITLRVADMRWGITEQMGRDDLTVMACVPAFDKSHVVLGCSGAKYGSSNLLFRDEDRPSWNDHALQKCVESVYPQLEAYAMRSITAIEFLQAYALHGNFFK